MTAPVSPGGRQRPESRYLLRYGHRQKPSQRAVMRDDLTSLKIFVAVAECGNLTRAAERSCTKVQHEHIA